MDTTLPYREESIHFSRAGNTLYGVMGYPGDEARAGVVLVHGWSGCRTGPHRILVEASRRLNALGFATLRFDLSGRGESEGDPFAVTLDGMIDDTCAALDELESRLGPQPPIGMLGMCSGGNVALGAVTLRPQVRAAACWSTYPFQSQRSRAQDVRRTGFFLKDYLAKAFRRETWKKLLGGTIDFRMVLRVLFGHYRKSQGPGGENPKDSERDIVGALKNFQGRLLFVFGGRDPEAADARRTFDAFCLENGIPARFHEIEGANHNFYSLEWKRQAIEISAEWLRQTMA